MKKKKKKKKRAIEFNDPQNLIENMQVNDDSDNDEDEYDFSKADPKEFRL